MTDQNKPRGWGYRFLMLLHWVIIINFALEIGYGSYMVFFVVGEGGGPLMGAAASLDHDVMVTRRLYALETWIAMTGLSIYLAFTEIIPRFKRYGRFSS